MKSPAFQFYPDDFLAGVADMTQSEVGAYILLLCQQWNRGSIPVEPERQQLLAKGSVSVHVLGKFKKCEDGQLRNERLEKVRSKLTEFIENQRQKGIASAKARAAKAQPRLNSGSTTVQPILQPEGQPEVNSPVSSLQSPLLTPTPSDEGDSKKKIQKGPLQLRAEKLMGRRVDTPLTRPEQRAFKSSEAAIKSTTEDQWKALERFYAAPQEETFARKDLATLVNNWNGEIDRAVAWAKSQKPNTSAAVTLVMVREYIEEKMPKNPNNPSWSATIFRAINEQKIDDWKLFTSTQIAKWRTQ